MLRFIVAGVAAVTAGTMYFFYILLQKRRELDHLPCPPMKNRLFGHLELAGECTKLFPPDCHLQAWFPYLQKAYNQGDCFYVDWWPLGPRWLFISDPEISSQFVTGGFPGLRKSFLMTNVLDTFLGRGNMVSIEGQHWKNLRSIYNPGFSASHLMSLSSYIVDSSLTFLDIMREKARTGELFVLEEHATRLTIDIIGKVVLDADFDSQKSIHPIVSTFRERVQLLGTSNNVLNLSWFEFRRRFRLWRNGTQLVRLVGEELDRKMSSRAAMDRAPKSSRDRKRSVIDLALDAYEKEQMGNGTDKGRSHKGMDPAFRESAISSMNTFIFAGHDTTSSTIAYVFYLLHFHPEVYRKMVTELGEIFSPDATANDIAEAIKTDPYVTNRLEYTTAVIKETLRLFPPASTIRHVPDEDDPSKKQYWTDPKTGKQYPLNGWHIWPVVILVSRNPKFFPEPAHFIPERFLPTQTPFPYPLSHLHTPAGKDAWRPFEKGPRSCIGQELAMIETKIILALTVREFDFVAEFEGKKCETWTPVETYVEMKEKPDGKGRMTIEGHSAFQQLRGAAKPRDGMPGRMTFRKGKGGKEK